MKVLFIHGIGEVGGAERELLTYMDYLPSRGYEPTVICPERGPLRTALDARGIRTFGAAFPPWRKLAGIWKRFPSVWALRTLIGELQPDLVHVNEFWWVPQTLRAIPRNRKGMLPLVAHFRQDLPGEKVSQYELAEVADVCAVSEQVAGTLRRAGLDANRVHVLHSGLAQTWLERSDGSLRARVRGELGLSDDDLVLATVAHLFERKGYEVALRALHRIVQAGLPAHYLIVGTGDPGYERRLRELCRELRIGPRVHFVGFRDDVRACLEAADLYTQPSLMEGFGISVLEAMACGRAVVASRTGGVSDSVVENVTGLLVPPGTSTGWRGRAASCSMTKRAGLRWEPQGDGA